MPEDLTRTFREVAPRCAFWSLRLVDSRDERIAVRRDVPQPVATRWDTGVMVTVADGGGVGYAATSDLTPSGLRCAGEQALAWAGRMAASGAPPLPPPRPPRSGRFDSPCGIPWESVPLADKLDRLRRQSGRLARDARILDWEASLWRTAVDSALYTSDGVAIEQRFRFLVPGLYATANRDGETQTRTFLGNACARQGGLEILDQVGFEEAAPRIAEQALELLSAPDCPAGRRDVVLAPDQMILQIHESIGHPLELDRILGDERNYAGSSFVTPEMFGHYRYGSELLNVSFDPTLAGELGGYAFDDEGLPAERAHLIRAGVLLRGLGGAVSQLRSGLPGVASSRATSWNRPPIDRMANLNLEPGDLDFDALVGGVERGVYMETNCSWSIDDSRNKFQFGCEWARIIEDGQLGAVVKKPNYRGVSSTFWRNLTGVGNAATFEVLGTPFCGKGEPNQVIRVGHASPACRFEGVEVFGGA